MALTTDYSVLPFGRNEGGYLCPAEAVECQSTSSAETRARAAADLVAVSGV